MTEWYVNEPGGIEQGFTIHERPTFQVSGFSNSDTGRAPLHLELAVDTTLIPHLTADNQAILFKNASGAVVFRYDQLHVIDADGTELTSWFELASTRETRHTTLHIAVRDDDAVYPLTIDPIIAGPSVMQRAKLTADDGAANDAFGSAVATDGSTLVVGAPCDDSQKGAAYVFYRSRGGVGKWGFVKKIIAGDGEAARQATSSDMRCPLTATRSW